MTDVTVGFVGMTHLGLVSATACAAKGFTTVCVDEDGALVERLARAELPVNEPGLAETLAANRSHLRFASRPDALEECDVIYVAPDIPTDDRGTSDLSAIRGLISRVTGAASKNSILVILSQVPPGFTSSIDWPANQRFYQVETLVFGRALERATQPERYIVGCDAPAQPLPASYAELLGAYGCPVLRMRYESAELAKISINMCLVSSISVANTLAALCERIGADWREIVPALRLDRRIGPHAYLKPGLGIAGGNLERDLATVVQLADQHESDAGVVRAWQGNSTVAKQWAARRLRDLLPSLGSDPRIAVWGLAYKENTHSTKNSPSLATIAEFPDLRFRAYDPVVQASEARHARLVGGEDARSVLEGARALLVLTPWAEFAEVGAREIADRMDGNVIVDPYAVLDENACIEAGLEYHTLGVAPRQPGV